VFGVSGLNVSGAPRPELGRGGLDPCSLAFAMLALERRSWSLVFGCCAVSFSRRRLIAACARRVSVGGCARYSLALATPAPHDQGPPPGSYKTSTRNM
jgi:hypothetical protein